MYLDKFNLAGRKALVTGGARGIGAEIAHALAEAGAEVVIVDIDGAGAASAAAALEAGGHAIHHRSADLSNADTVEALAEEICRTIGVIDILVNNAGIVIVTDPLETSEDDWKRTMSVNTDAVYYCAKAFGRRMKEKGSGSIVNIGSLAGMVATRPQNPVAYATSKGAVHMLTKSLAAAFAPHGVRVNAVAPSYIASAMIDPEQASGEFAEWYRVWMDMTPMARLGKPEEVASAVLFLASDAASFCTGAILPVDGGYGSI
ncbi:glucose 1-dehydrogenase [Sphingomonas histidinilytica]|uniref:NAD(P)-dependent dehydrogenase, short-chain alcohol dehydrogenase family n=1 Tax=Rhizorhabdus histidinilytica TaxID=439228 RepID=A0A1T5FNW2_9SPHN|nr:glucose 1-dehydrogenase [Rhizorhabdus histidinilytica]MBO9377126.1 glucose 1-dehydrogenase [Rhizorhabdus histidinilytica]QEH80013.1 glucose 1-dehydrogenase [Sphingomonas sp. C8-2]SKB97792.1 NAD(P)-dependent dehydrogenase, short-chain alcohol dehydrogenase family [Rhizorhabdus histidinilytica]